MSAHKYAKQAKLLKAVLSIGKNAVSERFVEELDHMLNHKELVKVKLLGSVEQKPQEIATQLTHTLKAELVLVIGKSFVLYRKNPKKHL